MELMVKAMKMKIGHPVRKLVLIKLCDQASDKGECWPSHGSIAEACETSKSSVIRQISELQKAGIVTVIHRAKEGSAGKEKTSNLYILNLDAPLVSPCDHPSSTVTHRTSHLTSHIEPVSETAVKKAKQKKPATEKTLNDWILMITDLGELPIPEGDPIFNYANDSGIPLEFLRIAWIEFKARYADQQKKYTDWRAVFRRAVRENWQKLWWHDGNEYLLTTIGQQAMAAMNNKNKLRAAA
jgi:hypothetical protein